METTRQGADAGHGEDRMRLWRRLLFPSSALIQDTRFSPPSSLHLTWTSCLPLLVAFLSEAARFEPGWVVGYLLIPVLKTDLTKNKRKVFVTACLMVKWTLTGGLLYALSFWKNALFKSQFELLTAFQKPSCHWFQLFFHFITLFPPPFETLFFPSVISITSTFTLTLPSHSFQSRGERNH